ncbi:MAG: FAD-binding domain-containing protein, partial [Bacteroidales bacterium]|nr:FAD-binding domain-containing protein [Bacteroidales bacterium]
IIINYENTRDKPYLENGVSRVGVELRFGRISIRKLAGIANKLSLTYLKELIWREFFMHILYHFPYVENSCFKPKYNIIRWDNNEELFEIWCQGKTGYPIVDAGMRELNSTGFMHNRVRMITASFLTKHLLIDWRWGELYFANKLMDYELSSNNGNWQWVAGCGCDAAPYFRIFNPITQQEKFDPNFQYIRKWVEEFGTKDYPKPIIDHSFARNRTLSRFKKDLQDE